MKAVRLLLLLAFFTFGCIASSTSASQASPSFDPFVSIFPSSPASHQYSKFSSSPTSSSTIPPSIQKINVDASNDVEKLTAYYSSARGWYAISGHFEDGLGWASYADRVNSTGWALLAVRASPRMKTEGWKDEDQGFVIGFLEGLVSAKRIYEAHLNWKAFDKPLTADVLKYCADQVKRFILFI